MFRKTVKKVLAFMIVATLCLTSLSFNVFAEALNDVTSGSAITLNASVGVTVTPESAGKGGKSSDDAYYGVVSSTGTTSSYAQLYATNSVEAAFTYEFSFMLPKGSNGITLTPRFRVYRSKLDWQETTMSISTSGFNPGGYHNEIVPGTEFEYDKWYNLGLVFPYAVANTEATKGYDFYKTMRVYVNGELKGEFDYTAQNLNYAEIIYNNRVRISPNDTNPVYIDNIRKYQGAYNPANDAAPTLTIADSAKVASVADGRIALNETLTVEALKNALATNGTLRVYNPAGVLLVDADTIPNNSTLVAASSNGTGMERTYLYYNVAKEAVVLGGTMYDGSTAITSGSQTTAQAVDGTFGKTDKVYELSTVANASLANTAGNHLEPFAIIQAADASQKVLEFSFMLPQGSAGIGFTAHQWQGGSSTGNPEHTIKITSSGLRIDYGDPTIVNYNFDYNKWYNIAIVLPGKTADESYGYRGTLYINGKNMGIFPMVDTIGIRRLRIHALQAYDTANVFAYIDNLRLNDSVYSNGAYDAEDAIVTTTFNTDAGKDKFYITENTTAQAVLADITDLNEDTEVLVLDSLGNVITGDAEVTTGCTIAVASKGGTNTVRTVSYYDVENVAGKFVIITPVISYGENTVYGSVTAINNTGEDVSFSAILAEYGDSLIECVPVDCEVPAGQKITFTDGISIEFATENIVRLLTWKSTTNDITPLLEDIRVW